MALILAITGLVARTSRVKSPSAPLESFMKAVAKPNGRKELARRLQPENAGLEVVHPHAAGIDMGNTWGSPLSE